MEAYSERMDCFRSGLDGAAAAGPVLEGRVGCAEDVAPPRKSKPNKESPVLFCFGGASCLGGALAPVGGPVLGL